MISKAYLVTSATVFALAAIVHFIRLVNQWPIQIGTVVFPFWGLWLAVIVGTALSIWAVNLISEWSTSRQ